MSDYTGNMGNSVVIQKRYADGETQIKNLKGDLGKVCNNCAGLGFTNTFGGRSLGCTPCSGSGVEPVDSHVLQGQIDELNIKIDKILRLLKKK